MSQTTAEAGVLDRAPLYLPSEHFKPGLTYLSNDPSRTDHSQVVKRGDASDSADYSPSESEYSKEVFSDKWNIAYRARFSPHFSQTPLMPKESSCDPQPIMMSWWPVPDGEMPLDDESFQHIRNENQPLKAQAVPTIYHESLLKRLEHHMASFFVSSHDKHITKTHISSPGGDQTIDTRPTFLPKDTLYNVLLTSTHSTKDVNSTILALRICGTYTSLATALVSAHRTLFSAGYEREWFTQFATATALSPLHRENEITHATGPGGEVFVVSIAPVANTLGLAADPESGRVVTPLLYHVVRTAMHYGTDERETSVTGSYPTYARAREAAEKVLLMSEEGITKASYAEYQEAGPGEMDCGFGENVVVHAVSGEGENFLVSVLMGRQMEDERLAEAARSMR